MAPIAGCVLRVHQKSCAAVAVGTALMEPGDPAGLEIVIELLAAEAPQVALGPPVRLAKWGGPARLSWRVESWGFTKVSALGVEEQRVNVLVDIVSPRKDCDSLGEGCRLDAQFELYRTDRRPVSSWRVLVRVPRDARTTPARGGGQR